MTQAEQTPQPVKLLFVDDELEFASVMSKRLGRLGYQVAAAGDGSEALRLARATDFEVAVLDLKMAGMDGTEVLRTLLMLLPRIKVVMLTGHGSREIAEQCLQMGAFAYLNKPCAFGELVANIERA
ncbi:MAG: response regulator, partial [Desulfovibrio sp.]|nr:response regulator [Desulfovibrio sp.]